MIRTALFPQEIRRGVFYFGEYGWRVDSRIWDNVSVPLLELILDALGTEYGNYTRMSEFYKVDGMARACADVFNQKDADILLRKFTESIGYLPCEAEMQFNLRYGHLSITHMSILPGSSSYRLPERLLVMTPRGFEVDLKRFHISFERVADIETYVYLFRTRAQTPPLNTVLVFDMRDIFELEQARLSQLFEKRDPPSFPEPPDVLIYKVKADVFQQAEKVKADVFQQAEKVKV